MNTRPKISSLSEKELAELLINCFFVIGKDLKLSAGATKIFLHEIYKKQGWMYFDTFSDAFSRYAAFELSEAENLRPQVSPRFISNLMKIYNKKCNENNFIPKSAKNNLLTLTPEEKFTLFVQFVGVNKCLPGNSDWVSIYEHLTQSEKITKPLEWDTLPYYHKWKYALQSLTEWAYQNCKL